MRESRASDKASVKRRRQTPLQPEMLIARIEGYEQTYFIAQDHRTEDEARIDIVGRIERASLRHKVHIGERIDIAFACSQSFNEDEPTATSDKPFLLMMNLSKRSRSFMAYLPSSAYWAVPRMIDTGKVTHIHAMFEPTRHGSGSLKSVYLVPEAKLDEL